ncbi:hypothetical protein STENM327S_06916 [Streptomyces tendae]
MIVFGGTFSAGRYFRIVSMPMYRAPWSMATSSLVIAATLSFAVRPPLKATERVSPTCTPCFAA